MSKNLLIRVIIAAIFIPVILWICYEGGWWLSGMVLFFALIGISEFLYHEKLKPNQFLFWLAFFTVGITVLSTTSNLRSIIPNWEYIVIFFGTSFFLMISGMILSAGKQLPSELFTKYSRLFWGVSYIALLYPFVYHIGSFHVLGLSGGDWLLLLFGILWIGDTFAMGIGKWFGKNKLAPTVSPNKTVEGFLGGLFGAVLIGIIMYFWKFQSIQLLHIIILSILCSVFGQLGDLVESMWKRSIGIKDSSHIIPGHGGILDRFDSLLFASPIMYFYVTLFI